ncbi:hypothetical protein [Leisingera caerulea]|uniref:Uncharacterized protein n=1 Tax=Leisingera caerulea TaxID=506591 RepID=A0A9Q9HQY7_LEICA|nr:hypothetical protein [Leisingera caerulea]UWQ56457.1 hypothetical protein K3721_21575 [Leisingera caerulea]
MAIPSFFISVCAMWISAFALWLLFDLYFLPAIAIGFLIAISLFFAALFLGKIISIKSAPSRGRTRIPGWFN